LGAQGREGGEGKGEMRRRERERKWWSRASQTVRVLHTSVSFPSFPVGAMTILSPGTQSTGC